MPGKTKQLHNYITRIALLIALAIAIGLPVSYWTLVYRAQAIELEIEAEVNAEKVTELIEANPETWSMQALRLQTLIGDDKTPTELPEYRALFDAAGKVLAESEEPLGRWTITERAPLYDSGQPAGSILIARDLSPLLARTGLVGLLGLVLGLSVFVTLRILPMRALHRAIDALREEKEKAEITLASISDAVITTDAENRVTFINSAAQRLTGFDQASALGQPINEIADVAPDEAVTTRLEDAAAPRRGMMHARDGHLLIVEYSLSPILDAAGKRIGGVSVLRDVTDRQRAEIELRELNERLEDRVERRTHQLSVARQEAEAANLAKSYFLANMSHEIRTPMNSVLGMTHLLLRTGLDARQRDYAEKIDTSGQHLLRLIDQILDLSKIEAGKLQLEVSDFNVYSVVASLSSLMWEQAFAKGLRFSCDVAPAIDYALQGDSLRVSQILLNLCSNAVKFTEQGSVEVAVSVLREEAQAVTLRFAVTDTGIGMNADECAHIFKPFQQADVSTTRKYGGSGLGLTISRQLAELMAGELAVDSVPGQGSTFWFTATFQKSAEPIQPIALPHVPAKVDDFAGYRAVLAGKRVLLAEDHPFNQEVAVALLEEVGVVTSIANNGQEALDRLDQEPFDCVLMDVQMPVLDGYAATRRIRENPRFADLFVVAMTANASSEDRRNCLAAGMDDFLTKPVIPQRLYTMLCAMLSGDAPPGELPAAGAVAAATELPTLDLSALNSVTQGDAEKNARYLAMFAQSAVEDLAKIRQALDQQDLQTVSDISHRIKSTARTIGAARFAETCAELEKLRNPPDHPAAVVLLARMENEFAELGEQLDLLARPARPGKAAPAA